VGCNASKRRRKIIVHSVELNREVFDEITLITHRQRYINEDKIDPNIDNFMIFAIL
jgi:hypothetical protein